jgi:hypothetical protein
MKQLGFIELSSEIEEKLIEQMAVVLFQVNVGGKSENDNLTTK